MFKKIAVTTLCSVAIYCGSLAQSKHWQHNERTLHYTEDKGDFLLVEGKYRFNRALYGSNKASRVEAGDLPEFALYMPGMGGNLQFVLKGNNEYKKLIHADNIETRYRPGAMVYAIRDKLLGKGVLEITVLAQVAEEGMIVKVGAQNVPKGTELFAIYGGASGKRFSRNGDIGADPESGFYLLPEYCKQNKFEIAKNSFQLNYLGRSAEEEVLYGTFGSAGKVTLADATMLDDISKITVSKAKDAPIVVANYGLGAAPFYIQIARGELKNKLLGEADLVKIYDKAESDRQQLANRVTINTPDRYINNFGATLAVAADGIWESPTFLHGAVAWRMRLNAWRGAYSADALGWHDRAKEHFSSYANSQVIEPEVGKVVADTALHLARHIEEMGTAVFSSGYISRNPNDNSRPHHYDMNLVFFDQLFSHFNYTGDLVYLKKMWPTIVRHLAWERRNFDVDRDGLYDAYCAIWASDGLQYSGGGVAHTSAYNYRANKAAAKLAKLIGEDPTLYESEAKKIADALRARLWLKGNGHFAEYQDLLGNKIVHDKPGLWTIYHIADAYILDDFDNYQNVQYIENHLPKIPVQVKNGEHQGLYTLATTNWQPYTWSVNNVALAENLQAALAYWQSGRFNEAFHLWKSNIIESMYHGISPGNFQQLSHYDAYRGELYRDFADPIGVASRTLVEGLFGIHPNLLDNSIFIKPGFPTEWDFAEIELPELSYSYKRTGKTIHYNIKRKVSDPVSLRLEIPVNHTRIKSVKVNGKEVEWTLKPSSINLPYIQFETEASSSFAINVEQAGENILPVSYRSTYPYTDPFVIKLSADVKVTDVHDPQGLVKDRTEAGFVLIEKARKGTFFVQLKQGDLSWWEAVNVELIAPVVPVYSEEGGTHYVTLESKSSLECAVDLKFKSLEKSIVLKAGQREKIELPASLLSKGSNRIMIQVGKHTLKLDYINWEIPKVAAYEAQDLSAYYNDRVTNIFEQKYLSPRPDVPTLQLPWQGIGNWCYPLTTAVIDDSGLMESRENNTVTFLDIPFNITGDKNVIFSSQWDNYPAEVTIPLTGQADKMYLLMAGSTNPMQSQLVNAKVKVVYTDGTVDVLELKNPTNWWPIEQDFLDDNFAFEIADDQIPYRIQLKTGELYKGGTLAKYSDIKGYSNRAIEGGAATLLDLPLQSDKTLQSAVLVSEANDVVVGIMGLTLQRHMTTKLDACY
ncbi:DUF4450 domain-containing protein [Sphingobacterium olei]|uniref:DUF4450 domain-containing protein n=2 Tax=Sphingobacterium olei TaxID=2571155 RepID=A0A4U0P4I3_9SPHI|nr:DUF4450 domain-containing protein [Sphingobacterium olei]